MQRACIWRVDGPATEVTAGGTMVCQMSSPIPRLSSLGAPKSARRVPTGRNIVRERSFDA